MRGKRIGQWIVTVIIAAGLIFGDSIIQTLFAEKQPLTVCGPEDMHGAFKKALSASGLGSEYAIVMTDDPTNADICVEYGKEDDDKYMLFAFSPFAVGYNTSDSNFKGLKQAETVVPSEFNKKLYELNFLKVIDEVIKDGQWSNIGVKDQNQIKIFYPAESTEYWHDFYNFMLVTVNGGAYPKDATEMQKAVEYVEKFVKSSCTEAVSNFGEKLNRTGGFAENCLYVMPEKLIKTLSNSNGGTTNDVRLFFPMYTSNCNYYVVGNTENGQKVVANFNDSFYSKLKENHYRSSVHYELGDVYRSVYDERDIYTDVEVPKENFFTTDFSVKDNFDEKVQ